MTGYLTYFPGIGFGVSIGPFHVQVTKKTGFLGIGVSNKQQEGDGRYCDSINIYLLFVVIHLGFWYLLPE